MSELVHVTGDATRPGGSPGETVVIAHVVNDAGAWGRGFVVALSRWDDGPERQYRRWASGVYAAAPPLELGRVQVCGFGPVTDQLWVANLVAQRGWRRGGDDPQALDPEALRECLRRLQNCLGDLNKLGETRRYRVVMPRIGCGLGGARWTDVEPLIREELVDHGTDVAVYSLPGERWGD